MLLKNFWIVCRGGACPRPDSGVARLMATTRVAPTYSFNGLPVPPAVLLAKIEAHASSTQNEVCGFLYKTNYVPIPNSAESPTRFYADPRILAKTLAEFGEPEV